MRAAFARPSSIFVRPNSASVRPAGALSACSIEASVLVKPNVRSSGDTRSPRPALDVCDCTGRTRAPPHLVASGGTEGLPKIQKVRESTRLNYRSSLASRPPGTLAYARLGFVGEERRFLSWNMVQFPLGLLVRA